MSGGCPRIRPNFFPVRRTGGAWLYLRGGGDEGRTRPAPPSFSKEGPGPSGPAGGPAAGRPGARRAAAPPRPLPTRRPDPNPFSVQRHQTQGAKTAPHGPGVSPPFFARNQRLAMPVSPRATLRRRGGQPGVCEIVPPASPTHHPPLRHRNRCGRVEDGLGGGGLSHLSRNGLYAPHAAAPHLSPGR